MEVSDADRRKEWSTNQSGMTQTVGTDADIIGVPRSVLAAACHIIRNSEHAESETAKAMRKYALSTQAAELDALRGEAERLDTTPWKDFHGDLPDYDHPLRCVFESGIQYAVNLLAAMLKVDDWEVCDGTEEFDGDLGGTLFNIVLAALPTDQHGDPMHPSEIAATITQLRDRVAGLEEIPSHIAEQVLSMGRAEWGATSEKTSAEHLADFENTLRLTRENFNLEDIPVQMHGLYLEGAETILCHTGTSPNSGANAQALMGVWNWLYDQCKARALLTQNEVG